MPLLTRRDDLLLAGTERLRTDVLPAERDNRIAEHPRWRFPKKGGDALPVFFPTDAITCERALTYALFKTTPLPEDPMSAMRLHDGEAHGKSVIHWLRKMGYEVTDEEKRVKKIIKVKGQRFMLSARIDGIITVDGVQRVLEIKGLSTNTVSPDWRTRIPRKSPADIVNPGYRKQGQIYMKLTGLEACIFAIKDKNSSEIHLYELKYDKQQVAEIYGRWAYVVKLVKESRYGEREYQVDSRECDWCRFHSICRKKGASGSD